MTITRTTGDAASGDLQTPWLKTHSKKNWIQFKEKYIAYVARTLDEDLLPPFSLISAEADHSLQWEADEYVILRDATLKVKAEESTRRETYLAAVKDLHAALVKALAPIEPERKLAHLRLVKRGTNTVSLASVNSYLVRFVAKAEELDATSLSKKVVNKALLDGLSIPMLKDRYVLEEIVSTSTLDALAKRCYRDVRTLEQSREQLAEYEAPTKETSVVAAPAVQMSKAAPKEPRPGPSPAAPRPPCSHCKSRGHTEARCWVKHPEMRLWQMSFLYPIDLILFIK